MDQTTWQGWDQLSPVLRHATFYDTKPGEHFGPLYIQDFQILFVQAGRGEVSNAGQRFDIDTGDLVFFSPNMMHTASSSVDDPVRVIGLHFLFHQADALHINPNLPLIQEEPYTNLRVRLRCPLYPPPPLHSRCGILSPVRQYCESLALSYVSSPQGRRMEKRGLLLLLFHAWYESLLLSDGEAPLAARHRRAVEQAQQMILSDLRAPPDSNELADAVGFSQDYFTRLFKQHTGATVTEFTAQQRLLKARQLLVEGRLNVSEVAHAVGFNDAYYFSRRFSREFGMAPSVFRDQHSLL
ncbi:MAG: AraC family transcriptional regulator [Anaerolineae bacterium]|nr:AraC family transcriptional regulator [Anaerolineae bacterium]